MAVGRKLSVAASKKYPDGLRQRAVRLYRESDPKPVIRRLAEQLGVHHEALRNWIRQADADADADERHDRPTSEMVEENRTSTRPPGTATRRNQPSQLSPPLHQPAAGNHHSNKAGELTNGDAPSSGPTSSFRVSHLRGKPTARRWRLLPAGGLD
ncbi:transposase [Micromonospora peucetia]|uniref:transposase n=1 Tax=Micromonospora peucetia TaxID=47871 RepID=UPI00331FDD83